MNFSRKVERKVERSLFRFNRQPGLQSPSLIVGWSRDAGQLGPRVIDYLNEKLSGQEFGEIQPVDFFPLGGVEIEENVAQFPKSKFYACEHYDLMIFKSDAPRSEWYRFLNSALDVAEHRCRIQEVYTIGGMVTLAPHTTPRQLLATANSLEMKKLLSHYGLARDIDYDSPPGQRPTLNSFLLWTAKRRNVEGANLWVPIPFYLVASEDPTAWKTVLEFLDKRFDLALDFHEVDEEIKDQNERLAQARIRFPEIDGYIRKLESSLRLSDEESEKLVREIEKFLKEGG